MYWPTNDLFASAITISGTSGTQEARLERLGRESGEPQHKGTNLVSMWYNWTPSSSGQVTFTPQSVLYNVSIYTGSAVSSLTLVTESTLGQQFDLLRAKPKATFTATGGTTYRIALVAEPGTAYGGAFTWNQPTAPTFIQHPEPVYNEVIEGDSRTLYAYAIGNPAPTFQWKLNGVNITGATATNYTITSMTVAKEGNYTLLASNTNGTATSDAAAVVHFPTAAQPVESEHWTNNVFKFSQQHVVGYVYQVQGSTNLIDWVMVQTNTTVPFTFTDNLATNYPYRFYRSIYIP